MPSFTACGWITAAAGWFGFAAISLHPETINDVDPWIAWIGVVGCLFFALISWRHD